MLTKKDLIEVVKNEIVTTKQESKEAVDAIFNAMADALAKGDTISINGFGSFTVKERSARKGINPLTKEKIDIPASKAVKFKSSSTLKNKINK